MASELLKSIQCDLKGLASGPELLKQLANLSEAQQTALAPCLHAVLREAKAGRGSSGAAGGLPTTEGAASIVDTLMFLTPRGKHSMGFFRDRFVISSARTGVTVPYSAVTLVGIFDNIPQDKKGKVLLFIAISPSAGVMHGKKALRAVVIETLADAVLDIPNPETGEPLPGTPDGAKPAVVILCQALGAMGIQTFVSPDPSVFQTADKAIAITAYVRANSGWLFPLKGAFAFVGNPAVLISHESVVAVEVARMQPSSATFDLTIHAGDDVWELSTIDQCHAQRVLGYLQDSKLHIGPPPAEDDEPEEAQAGGSGAAAAGTDDDVDSDADDSDFDPSGADDGGRPGKRARRSDGAGASASAGGAGTSASAAGASGSGSGAADVASDDEDADEDASEEGSDEESDSDESELSLSDEEELSAAALRQRMAME